MANRTRGGSNPDDAPHGHTSTPEEAAAPSLRILKDGTVWLDGKELPEAEAARYRPAKPKPNA